MLLPLMCPLLGAWPATQTCALTGNQTGDRPIGLQAGAQSTEPHQPGHIEHLLMDPLAICVSSLGKCLFRSSAVVFIGLFFVVELYEVFRNIYILDMNSLSYVLFTDICFHSVGCCFVLLVISFAVPNLFSGVKSHLFTLFLSPLP